MIGAAAALAAGLALTAFGSNHRTTDAGADNNGVYVTLDDVSYQLQVSRELNRFSSEDHGYLAGIGNHPPGAKQIWYGVFLRAINKSNQPRKTADSFDIRDTQGKVYEPVPIDPATNQYVWTSQTLQPLESEPGPDTTANFGPTQGALVLFKLDTSAYANRPLTLEIHSGSQTATISLDL